MHYWKKIGTKVKNAPKTPGVYIFYEPGSENADAREKRAKNQKTSAFILPGKNPLYVGKAANLRNRLQSYMKGTDNKSERLREHATHLKLLPLRSEIEALIKEAELIKKLGPPYNILWRDDKTYFYAAFTKERFPRIFVTHKTLTPKFYLLSPNFIGPFTEGRALKLVLRMLRRNFPYCTCPRPHLRLCLNAQIGNCSGFCCITGNRQNKISAEQIKRYRTNIGTIKNFLCGKPLKKFTNNLKPEEREALKKILAHREFLDDTLINADEKPIYADNESASISRNQHKSALLIEGYDISHLAGREAVAGMTAWEFSAEGEGGMLRARKEFWRKFIIRTAKPADDPAAIAETVIRRLNHPEWPCPDMMIIDGGLIQFNAVREIVKKFRFPKKIRVISFAKPGQLVYGLEKNPERLDEAPLEFRKIIPKVIAETHNFAIRFHRERRRKYFLPRD